MKWKYLKGHYVVVEIQTAKYYFLLEYYIIIC